MTIKEEFIEIAAQAENEFFEKNRDDPYVSEIVEEMLKRGNFCVFKIHKYPKKKPWIGGSYVVRLADGTITTAFYSKKCDFFEDNDPVEWYEFD